MSEYKLKTGKTGKEMINTFEKVEDQFKGKFLEEDEGSQSGYRLKTGKTAETVTKTYQKIENRVVEGYKKIEDSVVGGYKKVEQKFVDTFLEKTEDKK